MTGKMGENGFRDSRFIPSPTRFQGGVTLKIIFRRNRRNPQCIPAGLYYVDNRSGAQVGTYPVNGKDFTDIHQAFT